MNDIKADKTVEAHLECMERVDVTDNTTAHQALAHATAAVTTINQGLRHPRKYDFIRFRGPVEDIMDRLQGWVTRLLDKLDEIVAKLAKGSTFSLSVGSTIAITINFPPVA
ncbi:hypothetical protein [Ferrimicrobium acidiphilum]|uniref:hypothetical protein n=1 Tax=Ferrimicrobium acidiphilum TaxID=121039 RepID=UPI0023F11A8D|nr:hypothetical protein [Ferrimicrobium acidiphilum]